MKKIIVVTGGAGFIGSNLIKYLIIKTNYNIISIDNYSTGSIVKLNYLGLNSIDFKFERRLRQGNTFKREQSTF